MTEVTRKMQSIDDQAVEWMARKLSGAMSPEEKHRFESWLETPAHKEAYDVLADVAASADDFGGELLSEAFEAELHELEAAQIRKRRRVVPILTSLAATLLVIMAVGFLMQPAVQYETSHYATTIGDQDTVPLIDGSTIMMNTSTQLDVAYNDEERLVTLAGGEAFFNVAREPERAFSVITGHGRITVTGTSFNVRVTDSWTGVSVVSGAVDVRPNEDEVLTLLAGDSVRFGPEVPVVIRTDFDATSVLSWRNGRVVFEDTPLWQVTAELNRYFPVPITLTETAPRDAPVTGEFDISDQSTAIRGLSLALSLEAREEADRVVLVPAARED